MGISIFKKTPTKEEQIDIQTAFNIWNTLEVRYRSIQTNEVLQNFIHDKELLIASNLLVRHFKNQVSILEKEGVKFQLKMPSRPPEETKFSVQINEMTDKFLYNQIISDLVSEMYSLSRTVRTTMTHDSLRSNFYEFLVSHITDHESLIRYGKAKSWPSVNPDYKTCSKQSVEQLSLSDAYHLWYHIQNRYSQLELTQFFLGYAHDVDFKALINLGMNTLKSQIQNLVQLGVKYEVPLPERPPSSSKGPIDPDSLEDRFMYQQIFRGIDESIDMHIRAIIEVAKNDSLRQTFVKLFKTEMDIHDKMIKYGKMKGWAFIPPIYSTLN